MKTSLFLCLFFALLLLPLNSCGITVPKKLDQGKLYLIKPEMTSQQLKSIYGKPASVTQIPNKPTKAPITILKYELYPFGTADDNFGAGFLTGTFAWWIPNLWNFPTSFYFAFEDNHLRQWGKIWDDVKQIEIASDGWIYDSGWLTVNGTDPIKVKHDLREGDHKQEVYFFIDSKLKGEKVFAGNVQGLPKGIKINTRCNNGTIEVRFDKEGVDRVRIKTKKKS